MGLKRFDGKLPGEKKNFKQISIVLCICLIAVLSFTSYALYQVQDQKDIANSKVGEFTNADAVVAVYIDNVKFDHFPTKESGKSFEKAICTNNEYVKWDEENWKLAIKNINGPTECTVYFSTFYADVSGAEVPDLNNGLIPVMYENQKWVKADIKTKWYDYDTQWWANAVTVSSATRNTYTNASAGTEVKMTDIETMWVWVPRYEYQHTNLSTQHAGGTQALPGGITINFISKDVTTPSSGNYTIHDAFWWDNNNDGVKEANEQLSGIWVAKFEMSSDIMCTASDLSVGTDCDITTINPQVKPNVASWRGARIGTFWTAIHNNMNGVDNIYGLTNSDAHLMKNMEWGAVAYLSQSKYGKYGNANYEGANKEVYQNKSTTYITGSSNGIPGSSTSNIQVTYEVEGTGTGASTTGNIYGIYDMSGGSNEYVMGLHTVKDSNPPEPIVGSAESSNSGWGGILYDGGKWTQYSGDYGQLRKIESKHYDLYAYGTTGSDASTRYHKGDATHETSGWFSDTVNFLNGYGVFFVRGGHPSDKENSGIFYYFANTGCAWHHYSSRITLVQVN